LASSLGPVYSLGPVSDRAPKVLFTAMLVKLHDFTRALHSPPPRIRDEWAQLYAPFLPPRAAGGTGGGQIHFHLTLVSDMPTPPAAPPSYTQPDLAAYPTGDSFVIHLPRLGQLRINPAAARVEGAITPAALDTYGAFEDINAIALAPLLRRRGRALIHAFAAAHNGRALLLTGDCASGKTTTGLALLAAGWKLISNDSPMLGEQEGVITAFAYPGRLSAHADALRRIPALRPLADNLMPRKPGWKISFAAKEQFPSPWQPSAPLKAICLLQLEPGATEHKVEPLSPAVALGRLLPHSVDRWDQETLDFQINLLQKLAQQIPAYLLHLGPDVPALPGLLERLVTNDE